MDEAYRDYLELFAYFGRGGAVRLSRDEFEPLNREFAALVALRPNLSREQVQRVLDLRELLLAERPLLSELLPRK